MSAVGGKADIIQGLLVPAMISILAGSSAPAVAFLATDWPVGDGHRAFSLFGRELAEHYEQGRYEKHRNAAADDPNGNLDRKRIGDTDGVTKNIDQVFHVISAR